MVSALSIMAAVSQILGYAGIPFSLGVLPLAVCRMFLWGILWVYRFLT